MSKNWAEAIALLWMGITAMIVLARHVILLPIRTSLKYNEGWNAYQAAHAFSPEPPLSQPGCDNFQQLSTSFLLHRRRPLGKFLGDNIIAGRVVSLFAFIFIGAGIGWIVAKRFGQPVLGLFMNLFFLAIFGYYFSDYIAIERSANAGPTLFKWQRWYGCCAVRRAAIRRTSSQNEAQVLFSINGRRSFADCF